MKNIKLHGALYAIFLASFAQSINAGLVFIVNKDEHKKRDVLVRNSAQKDVHGKEDKTMKLVKLDNFFVFNEPVDFARGQSVKIRAATWKSGPSSTVVPKDENGNIIDNAIIVVTHTDGKGCVIKTRFVKIESDDLDGLKLFLKTINDLKKYENLDYDGSKNLEKDKLTRLKNKIGNLENYFNKNISKYADISNFYKDLVEKFVSVKARLEDTKVTKDLNKLKQSQYSFGGDISAKKAVLDATEIVIEVLGYFGKKDNPEFELFDRISNLKLFRLLSKIKDRAEKMAINEEFTGKKEIFKTIIGVCEYLCFISNEKDPREVETIINSTKNFIEKHISRILKDYKEIIFAEDDKLKGFDKDILSKFRKKAEKFKKNYEGNVAKYSVISVLCESHFKAILDKFDKVNLILGDMELGQYKTRDVQDIGEKETIYCAKLVKRLCDIKNDPSLNFEIKFVQILFAQNPEEIKTLRTFCTNFLQELSHKKGHEQDIDNKILNIVKKMGKLCEFLTLEKSANGLHENYGVAIVSKIQNELLSSISVLNIYMQKRNNEIVQMEEKTVKKSLNAIRENIQNIKERIKGQTVLEILYEDLLQEFDIMAKRWSDIVDKQELELFQGITLGATEKEDKDKKLAMLNFLRGQMINNGEGFQKAFWAKQEPEKIAICTALGRMKANEKYKKGKKALEEMESWARNSISSRAKNPLEKSLRVQKKDLTETQMVDDGRGQLYI